MIYLKLFISFLQIGMFSFGGGYAAMPLIQGQVVNGHQWLTMAEFTDLVTISQMTPGPIAVNSATFVGWLAIYMEPPRLSARSWMPEEARFIPDSIIMKKPLRL